MFKISEFIALMPVKKIRLLPVLMASAVLLLGFKCSNIVTDAGYLISPAHATTAEELAKVSPSAGEPAKTGTTAPAGAAAGAADDALPETTAMSRSEIGLLQELSVRRSELKQRESQLDMRERLLQATEKRVNDKIAALKASEAEIKQMMVAHDEQEEARLKSLVKVYENMKPQDSARILEKLDSKIRLDVVQRMSERKIAAVLAAMSPDSAKSLTMELATRKPFPVVDAGT
jgi:flagellar motility protein MotE (MotC chaperone)